MARRAEGRLCETLFRNRWTSTFALSATVDNLRRRSRDAVCQPKPRAQRALGEGWRRGRDSNPRAGYPARRFRGAPVTTTSVPLLNFARWGPFDIPHLAARSGRRWCVASLRPSLAAAGASLTSLGGAPLTFPTSLRARG